MNTPSAPSGTTTDPFSPTLQRIAAASGILFVLLIILSIVVNPESIPDPDAAPQEFLDYVSEEKDNIELSSLFGALAGVEWLWFVGVVTSALARAESAARGFTRVAWATLAGGLVAVTLILAAGALLVTASATPDSTEPSVIRALVVANQTLFTLAAAGFSVMFFSAAIIILRAGGLPRWLGWVGLLASLFFTLVLFAVLAPEDNGGAFEIFYPLSLLSLAIWVIGASIALLRNVGRETAPLPPAA